MKKFHLNKNLIELDNMIKKVIGSELNMNDFESFKLALIDNKPTNNINIFNKIIIEYFNNFNKEISLELKKINSIDLFCDFTYIRKLILNIKRVDELNNFYESLKKYTNSNIVFLGQGSEGAAFTDNNFVYKFFFDNRDIEIICNDFNSITKNSDFYYQIEPIVVKDYNVIKYEYEESIKVQPKNLYKLLDLLKEMETNNYIYGNINLDNIIEVNNEIKIIDYGDSFVNFNKESFRITKRKVEILLENPNISYLDFRKKTKRLFNY